MESTNESGYRTYGIESSDRATIPSIELELAAKLIDYLSACNQFTCQHRCFGITIIQEVWIFSHLIQTQELQFQ